MTTWLPPTLGLLASSIVAILATAPPGRLTWARLLFSSVIITVSVAFTCAATMFLTYVVLPDRPDRGPIIRRTSAAAACIAPFVILLQQHSLLAPLLAAFIVWTLLPVEVAPKQQWKKFAASILAAVLLQIAIASELGDESRLAALAFGLAAAPVLWRIRQERSFRGAFQPKWTFAIALLLAIIGLTEYLPKRFGGVGDYDVASTKKPTAAAPEGVGSGGKYRGVILSPEEEQTITLVVPLPMMGRNPFQMHKAPLGIPFYGVYWFFQSPDRAPNDDAYRVKGTPETKAFRSADRTPLNMEAHQNLGRLIDVSACSRIDVAIHSSDDYPNSIAMELLLVNTAMASKPKLTLGRVPVTTAFQTLSFSVPPAPFLQQFDELTLRFHRAPYRATKSAKIAIERFFLIPRK